MAELRFGVQGSGQLVGDLPDPGLFAEVARRAEESGYDSIWAGDHISFENPILEVTVALSAFAAVTSRIAIGAGIVLLPVRRERVQTYLGGRYGTGFSRQAVERYCVVGAPGECAARVREYADAGVRHLVFNPAVPPDGLLEQVERLAEVAVAAAA